MILRCSYVVGRGDDFTAQILREAQSGCVTVPGSGLYRIQPILLDDLLEIVCRAVESSDFDGNHDVVGESVSIGKFIEDCAQIVNARVRLCKTELDELLREGVFGAEPRYSPSELAVIVADRTRPMTAKVFGVELHRYSGVLAALREDEGAR